MLGRQGVRVRPHREVAAPYLPYISPTSPLYLRYISPISPLYLPHISRTVKSPHRCTLPSAVTLARARGTGWVGVGVGVRVRVRVEGEGEGEGRGEGWAAVRSDLEPLRMAAHALDDADHLGARLHDHLAQAHRGDGVGEGEGEGEGEG